MEAKRLTEHDHQVKLMQWCHRHNDERASLIFAIPNGGLRSKSQAAKLKMEGVKAGIPDLFLPVASRGYYGLFIELKRPNGKTSPKQKEWMHKLREEGYRVELCYGHEEAQAVISDYLCVTNHLAC